MFESFQQGWAGGRGAALKLCLKPFRVGLLSLVFETLQQWGYSPECLKPLNSGATLPRLCLKPFNNGAALPGVFNISTVTLHLLDLKPLNSGAALPDVQ